MAVSREDRCEIIERNTVLTPTGLVYLASILSPNHTVYLFDFNGRDQNYSRLPIEFFQSVASSSFLIFRSTPPTLMYDYHIAEIVKQQNPAIQTIMLNWSLSPFSAEVLRNLPVVDYYVHDYYYEKVIPNLLEGSSLAGVTYRSHGRCIRNESLKGEKLGDIPQPRWNLIHDFSCYYSHVKSISPYAVIRGSKGCGLKCSFCVDSEQPWDARSPTLVAHEVSNLVNNHGVKYLSFFDNTFNFSRKWALDVSSLMGPWLKSNKVKYFINARSKGFDEELVTVLKESGLDGVSLGVESGNDDILKRMNKRETVQHSLDTIKLLKKHSIKVYVSLIIGYLGETRDQIKDTYDFVLKAKPNGFQFSIGTPFPNTRLYQDCLERGLIPSNFSYEDFSVSLTSHTKTMSLCDVSPSELERLMKWYYTKLYLHPEFVLPNIWWCLNHPRDLKIACQYAWVNAVRMMGGMKFSH